MSTLATPRPATDPADSASAARRPADGPRRPIRKGGLLKAIPYIAPHFIVFAVFGAIPIVFGIYLAFTRWNLMGTPEFIGLENFRLIFDPDSYFHLVFFRSLRNTLLFVVLSVALCISVPLLLATALQTKDLKLAGLFQAIFYIPGLISIAAAALVWKLVFNSQFGLINSMFGLDVSWLGTQPWAWVTIFVLTVWGGIGGNLIIYRSALSGVDQNLYEAASMDGAGAVRTFFSVTLPGIRLPLFYTLIMTTVGAFNVWGQPLMLTQGGPASSTRVILMEIKDLAFPAGPAAAGMASAMALLLGVILMLISVVQIIFMNRED
ncbi:carbohydrate ABC transporter permease [Brachybacterium sp. DNPG3]